MKKKYWFNIALSVIFPHNYHGEGLMNESFPTKVLYFITWWRVVFVG
jgi:hypothetical protein